MIRKLRTKFIITAMLTVLILLTVIIIITNYMNYQAAISEADDILMLIPRVSSISENTGEELFLPYESRFFSVTLNQSGNMIDEEIKLPDSSELSEEDARAYAIQAVQSHKGKGVLGDYRYIVYDDKENTLVEFVNIGQQLETVHSFFISSIWISSGCYLLFFVVLLFFSGKFIKPVAESYEKQRRFLTNAGHGLKTPLTIIDADVEVLKMDLGENEWLDDIQKQTAHLTSLTNDLVFLSKLGESSNILTKIDFPVSELLEESSESFLLLASSSGKQLQIDIEPMMTYHGDERSIQQLISILLENAIKYSPEGGNIKLTAHKQGKFLHIAVWNTTAVRISKNESDMIFDRFYRSDSSLSSEISGHGIGLSVAKAIVESHGGHIEAVPGNEPSLKIMISLPL